MRTRILQLFVWKFELPTLRKRCPYSEFFWSVFFWSVSPFGLNTNQKSATQYKCLQQCLFFWSTVKNASYIWKTGSHDNSKWIKAFLWRCIFASTRLFLMVFIQFKLFCTLTKSSVENNSAVNNSNAYRVMI